MSSSSEFGPTSKSPSFSIAYSKFDSLLKALLAVEI
ncbi:hypothetical protein GGP81_002930 [Salinibacter ruber]|jgi:hypothetical protein|uniref:Uncharacterized protein n=1 Tax=Salinibacter ruber TaxID=146919 RepID=A0A9X2Q459_9BACT|nr:hypothetical protein [Salinibacter ruber]MCS3711242.1 hypothetical protein [Salinibacter ruber]MCS3956389.1 hypothetical protein [Salinibacter ruber]